MPKRILIIGTLFSLGGLLAAWEVISALLNSHINLNFGVLMLPVGIGILTGKESSQWWGRFWIILGYLLCALLVIVAVTSPESLTVNYSNRDIHGNEALPSLMLGIALLALLLVSMHRLLYSQKANNYFNQRSEPDGSGQ